jgi:3-deoxy-7-phosphoheptulonate synthase
MASSGEWSPTSWRDFPIKQQASYPDAAEFEKAVNQIKSLPPIISHVEVDRLRKQLAEVSRGERFLLQGGDCAERFADCNAELIEKKIRILLQMSLVLVWGSRKPTVRIGRIAGQYAKPRSKDTEIVDGKEVFSFRGENVNGFSPDDRTPDPRRLVDGYFHSAATVNYARCLLDSGIANINDCSKWDLGFVANSKRKDEYQSMITHVSDSLSFVKTCGVATAPELQKIDFFISHEGLGLAYEEAMTRKVGDKYYNLSAQFLWIGDRTRQIDHAHVEFFRGIENPIGIKVGPTTDPDELCAVLEKVWPDPTNSPGKVTLITRFGEGKVKQLLPKIIKAVTAKGFPVVWCCDPCHGNTTTAPGNGYKTRDFDHVLSEILNTAEVHKRLGTPFGGIHLELTGENVTECTGGPEGLTASDLPIQYTSYCDPRLNYAQSMEVAFLLAQSLKDVLE